ncbi:MAG: enolase C-terminal domain-like protein [Candidatus Poribacteria bacterium]|nr:enolase C-terminal domain-like protein [Candidatus Poribacteria bacterium]
MVITDVQTVSFKYISKTVRDSDGHGHPGPPHEAIQTLLKILTDEGVEGYWFGANATVIEKTIKPAIVGQDPFMREKIWQDLMERQRLNLSTLADNILAPIDLALWDLAGRALNQPVYKILGGYRSIVPAYASTMCGDDLQNGLATPQDYAVFAKWAMERGYQGFKLHTWQPPYAGAPNPKRDIEACAFVRNAVGSDIPCMLDPYHYYDREAALYLAKQLEDLNYYWMEEPMDEHSMSSYIWLCQQTSLPICGPETCEGKMHVRAEWIKHGACDISRAGVSDVGGLTPLMKIVHLCESFGMRCEIHGGGFGNLAALCAMRNGEFYERGLIHPFVDYEEPVPWLHQLSDPMDDQGFVHASELPGLGMDINWDYIEKNKVD